MPSGRPTLRSVGAQGAADVAPRWVPGHRPDLELPAALLDRPALVDLIELSDPPVVLVCAPVGFGKTTLVRQWLEQPRTHPAAWLAGASLTTTAEVEVAVLRALEALGDTVRTPSWPAHQHLDSDLAEWLSGMPASVLVVDGLRQTEALGGVESLVGAMTVASGCGLRLVATARSRPTDELARRIARGSATLVSEDDLDLDPEQADELMGMVVGRELDDVMVGAAVDQVGGWATALVAIARGWQRASTESAMAHRTRSTLEVLDEYVIGEVVDVLDEEVRGLVAELGHLPMLVPELCDQLRGRSDSAELLSALRSGGGMVSPGRHDGWLVVHEALRGAVRRRVHDVGPERRAATVDAAAAWYLAQGQPILAIRVLAQDGRWDTVPAVVTDHLPTLLRQGQVPEVVRIFRSAPLEVFRAEISRVAPYAFLELSAGNVNRAFQILNELERWYTPRQAMAADIVRAAASVYLPDPRPAMLAAESALRAIDEHQDKIGARYYIPANAEQYRIMMGGHLLIAGAATGEWRRVQQHRRELPPEVVSEIAPSALVSSLGNRAAHCALAGELLEAGQLADRALAAAIEGDLFIEPATACARFARGEVRRAGGDWQGAVADLLGARDRANDNQRMLLGALASASLAHAYLDGGDPAAAASSLEDVVDSRFDRARTVAGLLAAARARILVARGDTAAALRAVQSVPPTPATATEALVIALQVQDFTLAEALIARWPVDPTVDNRVRRGLALAAHGVAVGGSTGIDDFGRVVSLAAKHDLVTPVVRLAEPLAPLLRATARKGRSGAARLSQRVLATVPPAPLPGRQLAVVRLLDEGLTLAEIAAELNISVSMVKKHTRAIYRALGVANRAEAVQVWTAEGGSRD